MTVTPAADAAYILPTLEGFRNKLLDLTTCNNLLNLSFKSQRAAQLLSFADCNLRGVMHGVMAGRQFSLSALPQPPKEKQTVDEGEIEATLVMEGTEGLLDWVPLHVQPEPGLDDARM